MKHFLVDEQNRRLVLVPDIYPTILLQGEDSKITRSSKQPRIFDSIYVWENVSLLIDVPYEGFDHVVIKLDEKGVQTEKLMVLSANDTNLIFGGSYLYIEPKV